MSQNPSLIGDTHLISSLLLAWYNTNKASHPWRLAWERSRDPYPVWVSEIMLQQTTLAAMTPIYEKFMRKFPSLRTLALAQEDEIKKTVQGLGYYRRFSLLHKGVQQIHLASSRRVVWPQSYEEWLKVPGVGDYTASALSSITLKEAVPVLDGNVIRVLCRLLDIRKPANDGPLKKTLKTIGLQLISHENPGDFNQALMELGQKVCRPTGSLCESCPVQRFCQAYKNKSQALAPQPKLRREALKVKLRLHIFHKENVFALLKRPMKSKFLRGTSGFLTEIYDAGSYKLDGSTAVKKERSLGKYLGSVNHSITHHQIKADVYVSEDVSDLDDNVEWFEKTKLASQLVSSLDMKAWVLLQKPRELF